MFQVVDEASFQRALGFINANEVLAYDTETTGLNVRRDKIVGFGASNSQTGFYIPTRRYENGVLLDLENSHMALQLLAALSQRKLVMFNASFDIRVTLSNYGIDLTDTLYADAMLLKHTCDEEFPFGLKEIATKLWGTSVTEEKEAMQASIKANDGTVKEYYKADTELLAKYCVADCLLTMRVYNHYHSELVSQGLESFYYHEEVLPLYKEVVIPMERAGVRLNMPLIERACAEITSDLEQLESAIQFAIEPELGLFKTWFLNKDYPQKSAGRIAKLIKAGVDLRTAQECQWGIDTQGKEHMFNLQSKFHLKKLLFDTLGEVPLSRTPTGQPQVDEEFLSSVADKYPWVARLIEFNKLSKLKGTYIERFLDEQEDGRFYPSFQLHRTVSGRMAGDLQQLPRPIGNGSIVAKHTDRIREFIVADADSLLCSADYEQLEPSIFAHTSGDPALQDIFRSGTDFYSEVAIRTERLSGYSSDKSASNYLGKLDKSARQKAKAYSLGIAYGMTGYKLQFEIGVTQNEADQLVQDYLDAFPGLASWIDRSHTAANNHGFVKTESGRVRRLKQAPVLFRKYGPELRNSLSLWKKYNQIPTVYAAAKQDRKTYSNLMNNAINFQVQGLAASIMNRASICIARELRAAGLKSQIVAQIHDELLLNVLNSEQLAVGAAVKRVMEDIVQLTVPLRTTPQFGASFKDCK